MTRTLQTSPQIPASTSPTFSFSPLIESDEGAYFGQGFAPLPTSSAHRLYDHEVHDIQQIHSANSTSIETIKISTKTDNDRYDGALVSSFIIA
jgi:hypothetical protein